MTSTGGAAGPDAPPSGPAASLPVAAPSGGRRRRLRRPLALAVIVVSVVLAAFAVLQARRDGPATPPLPQHPAGTVLRVAPHASGARTGGSWSDAGDLGDLPRFVAQLPHGGQIWVRADAGPLPVAGRLLLAGGGDADSPVVVRGVTAQGQPAHALLVGNRASPYRRHGASGRDVFTLQRGADHLSFSNLDFHNVGNAFVASGDVTDVTVTDSRATNVRRFFENFRTSGQASADVSHLTLRRISVTGFSKRVLRLRYGSHDILVEDVVGDSQQQDGDDFAIGIHLEGQVHDVVLRRVTMRNARDSLHGYWNGDGFATERDVHDVTFEQTLSAGNTDAGYDLKSRRTRLVDVTATGNKRNFRLWADDLVVERSRATDPVKRGGSGSAAQVWLGKGASARLVDCTFADTAARTLVLDLEPQAHVVVTGGRISQPAGARLQRLKPGATADLRAVARQVVAAPTR